MISDTLSEAIEDIRESLQKGWYGDGEMKKEIEKLVADMDRVRALLDAPPKPPKRAIFVEEK